MHDEATTDSVPSHEEVFVPSHEGGDVRVDTRANGEAQHSETPPTEPLAHRPIRDISPAAAQQFLSSLRSNKKRGSAEGGRTSPLPVREFLTTVDEDARAALGEAIVAAIIYNLEHDTPVWLEGLGIVAPVLSTRNRSRSFGGHMMVRAETRRSVVFEKCADLVTFQRDKHPGIIETKPLVSRVYPLLPLPYQVRWNEREVHRLVRSFFRWMKHEVIVDGFSGRLAAIGDFCSLHNRQGSSLADWYAGADIFLVPTFKQQVHVGPAKIFERPILESSWELLSAVCGDPLLTFEANLTNELLTLGFPLASPEHAWALENNHLAVGVFRLPAPSTSRATDHSRMVLVYCTEGLRGRRPRSEGAAIGTEFALQIEFTGAEMNRALREPPRWPARILTMAWVLLRNTPRGAVEPGFGFACGATLLPSLPQEESQMIEAVARHEFGGSPGSSAVSHLQAIFTTEFSLARGEHLSHQGAFQFINIVGITEEEAKLAETTSGRQLLMLLRHRGLDQVTKPYRPSIVPRSRGVEEVPPHSFM